MKVFVVAFWVALLVAGSVANELCEYADDGARVPHPSDCAQFIVCEQGREVAVGVCPSGLHFNRELAECDTKARAGCTSISLWAAAADTCDSSSCCACCDCSGCNKCSNDLTVCQGKPNNSVQAYPGICSSYISCQNNCATIVTCPKGQLWNPITQCCDTACNVNCPGSGYPCNKCSNDLTVCQGKPDNSQQAYPGDCNKYVVCKDECATPATCSKGQLWNPSTQRCDTACNVNCPGSGYPCNKCSNDLTVCQGKPDNSQQAYPGDCNKYVVCKDECATPATCSKGQLWNPSTQRCDTACNVNCPGSGYPCNKCSNDLTVCQGKPDNSQQAYPGDCNKYVVCKDECATPATCSKGQLWNPSTQSCDTACNVNCPGSGYPCNTCPNPDITVCKGKPNNTFQQYPNDCARYIKCNNNCAESILTCPKGQLWDPTKNACNDACSVDCPNSDIPCERDCPDGLTVCQGKPLGSLQPFPGNCAVFVICNQRCEVGECVNGQLWNPDTKRCEIACNVNCPGSGYPCNRPPGPAGPSGHSCDSPGNCRDQNDGTMFKDPNTNGYIVCQCECEIPRPCPPTLEFNATINACDWPKQANGSLVNCPPGLEFNSALGACDYPPTA